MEKVTFTASEEKTSTKTGKKYYIVTTSENKSGVAFFAPALNTPTDVEIQPSTGQDGKPDGKFKYFLPKNSKPRTAFSGSVTRRVGALSSAVHFVASLEQNHRTRENVLKVADAFDEWLKKEDSKAE